MTQVADVMIPISFSVRPNTTLREAEALMVSHRIRHLPVISGPGKLLGVVSDRDLKLVRSLRGQDQLPIDALIEERPIAVLPSDNLKDALKKMAELKLGCILVENEMGDAIGILTTTDVARIFHDFLVEQEHFQSSKISFFGRLKKTIESKIGLH